MITISENLFRLISSINQEYCYECSRDIVCDDCNIYVVKNCILDATVYCKNI